MSTYFKISLLLFIISYPKSLCANNNLPKFINYEKKDYKAGRQNWDITIDNNGIVYFANTNGLLYNIYGEWKLTPLPKKGVLRSVLADNDTIWCGGSEYGYFTKKEGDLNFHSLGSVQYQNIWDILSFENQIIFLTESHIIYYDKTSHLKKTYTYSPGIWSLTKWGKKIWGIHKNGEIGYLENGVLKKTSTHKELINIEIRKTFVHNNKLYIVLYSGKLFSFDGKNLKELELPNTLKERGFFTGFSYDKNSFCLGTIAEGFVQINQNMEIITSVNSEHGLLDNTILSMKKDELGNIWMGLDYGIAKLEIQGPVNQIFNKAATYDIQNFQGKTYIATNKGLFCNSKDNDFKFVENSSGQIWRLKNIENELYICHNNGLFTIKNNQISYLIDYTGVYDIARFENTNYFVLSTYHGLILTRKEGANFTYVENLDIWGTKKLIYDIENTCIWVEFNEKSISKLTLDLNNKIEEEKIPDFSVVFNTENGIYFNNTESLFKYKNGKFLLSDQSLIKSIKGSIQAMAYSKNGCLAYLQNKELKLNTLLPDGNTYSYNSLLKPLGKNALSYFEYLDFDKNLLRLATDRGITTFDINYQSKLKKYSDPVISSFTILNEDNNKFYLPYPTEGIKLSSGNKDLKFKFSINKLKYDVVEYRYKLYPTFVKWSKWAPSINEIYIPQVAGGNYIIYLQTRVNSGAIQETSFKFSIKKQWHETLWVILPITIVLLTWIFGVIFIMSYINKRKLNHQKNEYNKHALEKTLSMKNEQLLQYSEIISHKNEFLNKIKIGLEGMRNNEAKRWVNLILKEMNNEKKEFLFHKLFSEINQDFISRLTKQYPLLTSNDIRTLSFIRTNLSKKEICNLMNISPRSLDTNRYRLKKKMNFKEETDLDQFIRDF